jgi:hypothetical protein
MSDRGASDGSGTTVWAWRWGPDEQRRPGLPWVGVFLVVFGGLLLVEQALPDYRKLGDVAVLAAGVASLIVWLMRRSTIALYAGAFLIAVAAPGTLRALGFEPGPGWGTFCFGLAFLFVALVRWIQGGGVGWQALYGSILVLVALLEILSPDLSGIGLPLLLVVVGVILLVRGGRTA